MTASSDTQRPVPDEIVGLVRPVLQELSGLGEEVLQILQDGEGATALDVSGTRETIGAILDRHRELVSGCGVVMAPGVLADQERFLEYWWRSHPDATPEPLRANLDLTSPDTFDYTAAPWYVDPRERRRATVTGPYLDVACSNEYVLTLSHPVAIEDRLVAIAAADIPVQRLEARAIPLLLALGRPSAILNEDGRVLLSTSPSHLPGQRFGAATGGWALVLT